MKRIFRILVVPPLLALGACATIVEGDNQTVTIISDPASATCTLTRGGTAVGVVNPTPGSVVLEKSKDDVSVACKKEGHYDGAAALSSSFQNMTLGNILLGGLIGAAVDSATGAMHEYPPSVTVFLTPHAFPSAKARDGFFDRRRAQIEADARAAVARVRKNCVPDQQDCDALATAVNDKRDADLRALERQREAAKVSGG